MVFAEAVNEVSLELKTHLVEILSYDPRPSYQNDENRVYGLDFDGYSVKFTCDGNVLTVTEVKNDLR